MGKGFHHSTHLYKEYYRADADLDHLLWTHPLKIWKCRKQLKSAKWDMCDDHKIISIRILSAAMVLNLKVLRLKLASWIPESNDT